MISLNAEQEQLLTTLGIAYEFKKLAEDPVNNQAELRKLVLNAPLTPVAEKLIKSLLKTKQERKVTVAEAIIRPTGLLDPQIIIKPVESQVDDVLEQVRQRVAKKQRVLITTLTKKFAEDLDIYLKQLNIKSAYIHSEVDALSRLDIIADLRRGYYDVLIGINLLREGLDLPEVSLVAIFDADKEGFLRSRTSLIQIIGRAARHTEGTVIMYADTVTQSMKDALEETERRRAIQTEYNNVHGITPRNAKREIDTIADEVKANKSEEEGKEIETAVQNINDMKIANKNSRGGRYRDKAGKTSDDRLKYIPGQQVFADFEYQKSVEMRSINESIKSGKMKKKDLEAEMQLAIDQYNFEKAAAIRDLMNSL